MTAPLADPWSLGVVLDEDFIRRWPTLAAALMGTDPRKEKIERLIADPAATEGERQAARAALERIGAG